MLHDNKPEQPSVERMKSIFYTSLHEVGTPVNGIVSACLLLKDELDKGNTAYAQELLQAIFSAAGNLNEIYVRVKQLVREDQLPEFRLTETLFDFRKWLDELLRSMMALFMEKEISVVKQVPRDFPLLVFADKTYLTQIMYNILMNALKFSPESTVVSVSCFVTEDRQQFCIEVTDMGTGIPEEKLPFIFQDYYQVTAGVTARFGGMGLGLAIVKKLLAVMGGDITVRSEVGSGSTFTVLFPLNKFHSS